MQCSIMRYVFASAAGVPRDSGAKAGVPGRPKAGRTWQVHISLGTIADFANHRLAPSCQFKVETIDNEILVT
jgi:hypothetical protein